MQQKRLSRFVRIFPAIMFVLTVACGGKSPANNGPHDSASATLSPAKDSFPAGKITTVACLNDASQSYAIYVPVNGMNENSSLIFFFDPHADGSLPVKKYQFLADKYNFIFIGSNNSKNGNDLQMSENIWRNLFNDAQSRSTFNPDRMYTCGFSGGAKVAGYVALNHPEIKGVIANGAGLPDGTPAGNFNFTFTAITGEGDMNMTELVSITNELDKTQTRHRVIFFKGKHEWAPVATMDVAFEGLQLDAMRNKLIERDDAFIGSYVAGSKKKVEALVKANELIAAVNECELSLNMLDDLTTETNWFAEKKSSIENNAAYRKEFQAQQDLFNIEQSKKAEYNQQFQQGDLNYWTETIADLQSRSKQQTSEGAMYERLLAYLSLAFYSISNQLINANENKQAEYFVALYKKADPTNSEAWYFSAVLDARNNDAASTRSDLLQAVTNGFDDKDRMRQQPEFIQLSAQINLPAIESKIGSGN